MPGLLCLLVSADCRACSAVLGVVAFLVGTQLPFMADLFACLLSCASLLSVSTVQYVLEGVAENEGMV